MSHETDQARTIFAVLFPEGLKFTKLPFKLEWAEADARLARIKTDKLDETLRHLGGAPFLKTLTHAHAQYGAALGLTEKAHAESKPVAAIREPLSAFTTALRGYALQVMAHVDEGDAHTTELARTLLGPLEAWESRARATGGGAPPVVPPPAAPKA